MPSFHLPHPLALRPLPGHCLLRCSAAEPKSATGLLYLPETAAEAAEQALALRRGTVITVNRRGRAGLRSRVDAYGPYLIAETLPPEWDSRYLPFDDEDSMLVKPERVVWYLGHQDEMDNEYVVVKFGQICAIDLCHRRNLNKLLTVTQLP
jgi:hypothetical protein